MPDLVKLRDGTEVADPRLDRLVQFDELSRNFPVTSAAAEPAPRKTKIHRLPAVYLGNQGREGACAEYAVTHELAAHPVVVPVATLRKIRDEHLIYWPAQRGDQWAGGSYPGAVPFYEGTSVLSVLKVGRQLGFFDGFRWAFGIDQAITGVLTESSAVIGVDWTEGQFEPRPDSGLIRVDGQVLGGHAVAWIGCEFGVKLAGEGAKKWDVAVLAQSWGLDHGVRGRVRLPLEDMDRLLRQQGECAFTVGRHVVRL